MRIGKDGMNWLIELKNLEFRKGEIMEHEEQGQDGFKREWIEKGLFFFWERDKEDATYSFGGERAFLESTTDTQI